MSTLAELSPCNLEQAKNESATKVITRRPRFVMKPNIKTGPGKPTNTTAKPQVTKATVSGDMGSGATESLGQSCQIDGVKDVNVSKEITNPEGKTEDTVKPANSEVPSKKPQIALDDHVSESMKISLIQSSEAEANTIVTESVNRNCREIISQHCESNGVTIQHFVTENRPGLVTAAKTRHGPLTAAKTSHSLVSEAKTSHSPITATIKSSHGPLTPAKTSHGPLEESGSANCVLLCAKTSTSDSNIGMDTPDIATQQADAINSSEGMLGKTTICEEESSCSSECTSQEADKDKMADVEEEAKKRKRKRIKKQRNEPLPSRDKSPDRQKMKMRDLLSWNPQQNYLPKKVKKKTAVVPTPSETPEREEEEASCQSESLPAPQVMIGPDGSVVLNTESLMIHSVPDESNLPKAIEEDEDNRYLNTNSYSKNKKTKFWTEDETERFFLGLSMCGTDFSLMTNLLTSRSRRELKNKFHREERRSRHLIDKALANRRPYDPNPFIEMIAAEEIKVKNLAKQKVSKVKSSSLKKEKKPRKYSKKRKHSGSESDEDETTTNMEEDDDLEEDVETSQAPSVKKKRLTDGAVKESTNEVNKTGSVAPQPTSRGQEATSSSSGSILAIPGSTQVQIEMEGLGHPAIGVLVPKAMVPKIAPQLGFPNLSSGYQVLLVQEQSLSGNLVHVYIIPESDKNDGTTVGNGEHGTTAAPSIRICTPSDQHNRTQLNGATSATIQHSTPAPMSSPALPNLPHPNLSQLACTAPMDTSNKAMSKFSSTDIQVTQTPTSECFQRTDISTSLLRQPNLNKISCDTNTQCYVNDNHNLQDTFTLTKL